jgi:hypothetical protein
MARMIGPLPGLAWTILGLGALGIFYAGRDLNASATTAANPNTATAYPVSLFAFFDRFGRPQRHLPPPGPGNPGGPQGPLAPVPPGTAPVPTGHLPSVDSSAPPYANTSVFSPLTPQTATGITYVEAGGADNLYTMSVRNYNTPLRSVDIFNANREGVVRADGSPGIMSSPDFIEPGTRIIIP